MPQHDGAGVEVVDLLASLYKALLFSDLHKGHAPPLTGSSLPDQH